MGPFVQPTDGTYRISVYGKNPAYHLELTSASTVQYSPPNDASTAQLWNIIADSSGAYKIKSFNGNLPLYYDNSTKKVSCRKDVEIKYWYIQKLEGFFKIYPKDLGQSWVIDHVSNSDNSANLQGRNVDESVHWQHLSFDRVDNPPSPSGGPSSGTSYQHKFFTLTLDQAQKETYDIIIIGAGAGGGILAADLYETNRKLGKYAKSILVIEKGDLPFYSHCLNTSRKQDTTDGRNQPNDWFFAEFKDSYKLDPAAQNDDSTGINAWGGGPVYGLGGRSAVWSLSAPRVHDDTLKQYFDATVHDDLLKTYYKEAEALMKLFLPTTQPEHQHLIDRLNMSAEPGRGVQWEWGRIASEFREDKNFDFAAGAFSSIDKLLEIAMSKPEEKGVTVEHPKFKILLGTEVRKLALNGKTATGVVAGPASSPVTIKLAPQGKVILSGGSVHSPSILMRSGVPVNTMGGCHVTDHDMIFKALSFRYRDPSQRDKLGSVKLQSYIKLPHDDLVLANLCIDSNSFLPRMYIPKDDLPHFILVFISRVPLSTDNNVVLDSSDEPVVTITRPGESLVYSVAGDPDASTVQNEKWGLLAKFANDAVKTVSDLMGLDFIDPSTKHNGFGWTKLGGVAHEVGTLPMKGPTTSRNKRYCLETDLRLKDYSNIYVCDNSIFPVSMEVNPTLTLAALTLRLSRQTISPLDHVKEIGGDVLQVANFTGAPIQVWASRRCGSVSTAGVACEESKLVRVDPGDATQWSRDHNKDEAVFVYKVDLVKTTDPKNVQFLVVPELRVGYPGHVLRID